MSTSYELLKPLRKVLDNSGTIAHCLNCLNRRSYGVSVICELAPDAGQPPAEVLVYGCSSWQMDIPF